MTQYLLLEDTTAYGGKRLAGTVLDDRFFDVSPLIADGVQMLNITANPLSPELQKIVDTIAEQRAKGLSGLDLTPLFAAISLIFTEQPPDPGLPSVPTILWQPGGVEGGYIYTSWASVNAVIQANAGNVIVVCDGSIVPNGLVVTTGQHEMHGKARFITADMQRDQVYTIRFQAGAALKNPAEFFRLGILKTVADGNPIIINDVNGLMTFTRFTTAWNGSNPNEPIIALRCSSPQIAFFEGSTVYTNHPAPTRGLIQLDFPGGVFAFIIATDQVGGNFFAWSFEATASDFLYVIGDASCNLPVQTYLGGGTQLLIRSDKAANTSPSFGSRPTDPEPGQMHFDPNIIPKRPIWWDGVSQWVFSDGTPA